MNLAICAKLIMERFVWRAIMTLYRVADFADVPENRGLEVQVGDRKILLLRAGDQLRAYQGECPHAGAPLAEGAVCDGRLACPWHKARFRIEDGGLCEPPAGAAALREKGFAGRIFLIDREARAGYDRTVLRPLQPALHWPAWKGWRGDRGDCL
jgi:nitrite reductase/ring-hydroxylating ferredoxin subunit